jgi:hypothetical protein
MLKAERTSRAKSREATASREFRMGALKPSSRAVKWRSMGKPVPARAAAPRGLSLRRSLASSRRPASRFSIS